VGGTSVESHQRSSLGGWRSLCRFQLSPIALFLAASIAGGRESNGDFIGWSDGMNDGEGSFCSARYVVRTSTCSCSLLANSDKSVMSP
jgi:hypothetical protein